MQSLAATPGSRRLLPERAELVGVAGWLVATTSWFAAFAGPLIVLGLFDEVPSAGWAMPAFSGSCAVVGFHLTSLSIILSARSADQLVNIIGQEPGNRLIGAILTSMWSWAFTAATALAAWFAQINGAPKVTFYVFVGALSFSALRGVNALIWATSAFLRFTRPV